MGTALVITFPGQNGWHLKCLPRRSGSTKITKRGSSPGQRKAYPPKGASSEKTHASAGHGATNRACRSGLLRLFAVFQFLEVLAQSRSLPDPGTDRPRRVCPDPYPRFGFKDNHICISQTSNHLAAPNPQPLPSSAYSEVVNDSLEPFGIGGVDSYYSKAPAASPLQK